MNNARTRRLVELCAQAQKEQDEAKFMRIIAAINRLFDEEKNQDSKRSRKQQDRHRYGMKPLVEDI